MHNSTPPPPPPPPAIVKVVKENGVDTGLASSAAGGGGGGGVRRSGRGQVAGRKPKNILTAVAAETALGIPEAFRELVSERQGYRSLCLAGIVSYDTIDPVSCRSLG